MLDVIGVLPSALHTSLTMLPCSETYASRVKPLESCQLTLLAVEAPLTPVTPVW
jgi:hypothetical protein